MPGKLSGVNGEIIRWAREWYHLSPEEVSQEIGIDISRYLSWESGIEHPTYSELKRISDVLHKPSVVFFLPEPPEIPELANVLSALPGVAIEKLSKDTVLQFENARAYQLDLQKFHGKRNCIFSQRDAIPDNIQELCEYLRQKLNFSASAQKAIRNANTVFETLRERLYDVGVYVFKDKFQNECIAGISLTDDIFPVILINKTAPLTRQLFALAHELYHLVLNRSGVDMLSDDITTACSEVQIQTERACDAFASTFLLPYGDYETEFQGETIVNNGCGSAHRDTYSICYCIAADRQNEMGKMTGSDSVDYYHTKLIYLGRKYVREVLEQLSTGALDSIQASEMLRCKVDQLDKLGNALSVAEGMDDQHCKSFAT